MNIKSKVTEVLSTVSNQSANRPFDILDNQRHPLHTFSFTKCPRLKKQLEAQGVEFNGKTEMSRVCRIDQVKLQGDHQVLTLVAPIYKKLLRNRKGSVAFQVRIPKVLSSNPVSLSQACNIPSAVPVVESCGFSVGQYVRTNPSSIQDFKYPRPEFSMAFPSRIGLTEEINPFDFASPIGMDKMVFAPGSEQGVRTQELVNILATFFEFMNQPDKALLRAILRVEDRLAKFMVAPASTCSHHAYKHGLLEHTVEVCLQAMVTVKDENHLGQARQQSGQQSSLHSDQQSGSQSDPQSIPQVDLSMLILQSILHDLGKLDEYEQMGDGVYTLSGSGLLLGHQIKIALWADAAAKELGNYDSNRLMELIHGLTAVNRDCTQSGNRTRKTLESIIANQADRFSATVNSRASGSWLLANQFCMEV